MSTINSVGILGKGKEIMMFADGMVRTKKKGGGKMRETGKGW